MGASFTLINNQVNILRKKYLKLNWHKISESLILIVLTVTTMYLAVYIKYASHEDSDTNNFICELKEDVPNLVTR